MTLAPRLSHAWPFLLATLASVVLFYPSWARLGKIWLDWDNTIADGLPAVVAFLFVLAIHPPVAICGSKTRSIFLDWVAGGLLLIVLAIVWSSLELVRLDTLAFFTLPASLFAISWCLIGFSSSLAFTPYIAILSLSLPFWADLIPLLVKIATLVVSHTIHAIGITALIEGSNITLPYGRLVIADGCSGIGYLSTLLLVGSIAATLNDYRWRGWLLVLGGAILLALIINWVRIFALVIIADQTNMQSSLVREHELFGWLVFGAFALPSLLLLPVQRRKTLQLGEEQKLKLPAFGFIFLALIAGNGTLHFVQIHEIRSKPLSLNGSELREIKPTALPLKLQLSDQLGQRAFIEDRTNVYVSLAQHQRQSETDKIVPYLPSLVDRNLWFREAIPAPGMEVWRRVSIPKRVVVSHIYAIGPYRTNSYAKAKLLQLPAVYSGKTGFTLISLQAACETSTCEDALEHLTAFKAKNDI